MALNKKRLFLVLFFLPSLLLGKPSLLEEKIEKCIEKYKEEHDVNGISVAVIGREDLQKFQRTITKGTLSKKSPIPINCYSEFRVGPLTQLFTAAALTYFVKEGQVSLNDPASKFLPKSMKIPNYNGKEITLGDLATHTSGLPDMPYSLSSRSSFNLSQMYHFLSKYELRQEPGTKYEYSNFGYAFLSNILSRIAKRAYPEVINQIILHSLGMKDSTFTLTHEQKTRMVTGYEDGKGVSPLLTEKLYSVFLGAGGLFSTAQNMLTFLSFNLGKERTSLNTLLPIMQTPYHNFRTFQVGLGWKITPYEDAKLYTLGGALFGFSSYMAIIPEKDVGIVVLISKGDIAASFLGEEILHIMVSE